MLATHIPTEFEVVGENPVGQAVTITAELFTGRRFAFFHRNEIFTNVFGFDMAERHFAFGDVEIGRTTKNSGWFIGGSDSLANQFQEFFERRAMRMLGRVAVSKVFPDLS